MSIRPFTQSDAPGLARLSAACLRGEADFVLNPIWETESELFAEFDRHGIDAHDHLLVADAGDGSVQGMSGFLRSPKSDVAGLICPIVDRNERGQGLGGELLRAALELGPDRLGIKLAAAGIGTRNRAGYSLLTAHGFRPVRQHFLMRCTAAPETGKGPDGFVIEPAGPADAEAIHAIYTECGFETRSPERMDALIGDGRHAHLVARKDGRVVGFVELETHWPRRIWVSFVGVEGGMRSRGLGTALVVEAVARQFKAGAESGLLMLSPANRTALRAYEKAGFRRYRLIDVLQKGL